MEIKDKIKEIVKRACERERVVCESVKIEYPPQKKYGDYTAIPYREGKKESIKDFDKLSRVLDIIKKDKDFNNYFKKTELKGLFFNFFLSEKYLKKKLKEILSEKENFGKLELAKGKKIQVEFISANPTGPLTIGNARGGPFGDSLANVFKKAGFKTEKAYYVNDQGKQIINLGHSVLKDDQAQYKGEYIDYLSKKIKEKDPCKAGEKAAEIIIKEMIKKTTDRLGINYNEWFSEKDLYKSGKVEETINIFKKKKLIYEKEGASWLKTKDFGDERDRVLIRKDGTPTYLAGDIAYHRYKFEDKKFDKVINVWGSDHHGDVPGLKAGVEALGHKDKLDFVLLQFVTILKGNKEFKMSKRKGVYIALDDLLDEVGSDVVRFFFLQRSASSHLKFDLSLAKEQSNKNPVYYVQYAHARICSIFEKNKLEKTEIELDDLNHLSEINLMKTLIKFQEVIESIIHDYQLQRLPQYSIEVAEAFHKFYKDCKILCDDKKLKQARLFLSSATKIIIKQTLDLMGVSAPSKM